MQSYDQRNKHYVVKQRMRYPSPFSGWMAFILYSSSDSLDSITRRPHLSLYVIYTDILENQNLYD